MAEPREVTAGGMFWKALLNQNRRSCEKHSGEEESTLRALRWEKQAHAAWPEGKSGPFSVGHVHVGLQGAQRNWGQGAVLGLDCQCSDER